MTFTPALPLEVKSLFTEERLVFFIFAVVFRLMAIGVSIRLLVRNTPFFGRFSPNELQQPFKHLPKQQQYRYICSICLFSTLVVHLFYVVLDMVVASPDTPLSYKFGKVNTTIIISHTFAFVYVFTLCNISGWLILAEIDRYNRITLAVPGSLRAKVVDGAGRIVRGCTFLIFIYYWVTIAIRIRNEVTHSNAFSTDTMTFVLFIRDGFAALLTVSQVSLEFYLNLSMVKCVLYKSLPTTAHSASQPDRTDSHRPQTRIIIFLVGVLMANWMSISLMMIGALVGPYYPLVLSSVSSLAVAVSTSFSLTDTLLNCLHESKQEKLQRDSLVDITGYKRGTDVYEEGLMLSDKVGPSQTQYLVEIQSISEQKDDPITTD